MRYDDASQAGSFDTQSTPIARPDADALAAGSMGPASGNVITGAGTITGAAGADTPGDAPARIVSLQGASGGSSSTQGGNLEAAGQFGVLSMDGQGGYNYLRNAGSPEGGVDIFTYTLADANGDRASARLTITLGKEEEVDQANVGTSPLNAGIVTLPAGVELSDIRVVGRDLVVTLPDGSLMTIPGGAVFVPQLVIGDVQVPPTNVAALLIDSEPQPAAGNPQSSGGNFAVDVAPLDPGVPLGDLLPPTELDYTPPQFEDVGQFIDDEPEIFIIPDGGVQTEAAVDSVDESGLPARPVNEPAGSNASANSETTIGTIVYSADDTPATISITVNGTTTIVSAVNQVIAGQYGNLTITSIGDGAIGYSYTLRDNTSGNTTHDDFLVTLTDSDGDTDSATLRIDIVDDVPTARPDTDSIAAGAFGPATGNVITDAAAGDAGDSDTNAADTVGADNATLTSVTGFGGSADSTFDASGNLQVNGQYGVLLIKANGDYSYTRNANTPGGVTDTFNYTLTDGDTDTSSSTLTISIGDRGVTVGVNATVLSDDDAVPGANGNPGGTGDDADAQNLSGTLSGSGGDGALTFDLLTSGAPAGFSYVDGPNGSVLVQQVQAGSTVTVLTVTVNAATGAYTVTQNAPVMHASGSDENNQSFTINYSVTDLDNDSASGTLTINVDDDTPTINVTKAGDAEVVLTTEDADTIGAASDTATSSANFGGVFAVSAAAGADGAAAPSLSYALGVASSVSGLASHGVAINLYNVGGTIVGSTAGSAPASLTDASVVFTVAVSAAGVVTLTQLQQVDHAVEGTTTAPFDDQFSVLADGKITLTASSTITDRDGDPASDSEVVDLGGNIRFADDGPDVSAAFVANTTIRIDETDGVVAAGGEVDPMGGNLGTVTVARAAYLTVTDPHVSADAPTSYSYMLQLGAAGEGGLVSSGLMLSTTNSPIYLYNVGGTIVGSTALSAPATVNDASVAFTVSLNASGDVTLTQILAVEHGTPGSSHDEDSSGLAAGALSVVVKATDFDGDTDSAMVDLGSIIRFEDDGPAIDVAQTNEGGVLLTTQDAQTIGEASDTDVSMASFSNVFAVSSSGGSDGTASVNTTYALAVTSAVSGLMSHGVAINLYNLGGAIVGSTAGSAPASLADASVVFTVAVSGSGVVTLTQLQQVDHAVEGTTTSPFDDQFAILADGKISLTASSTITDNDGDTATDSEMVDLGGNLRFADDGPTVTTNVEGPESLFVSDADFSIDDTGNFSSFFNFDFGADGAAASGSIAYTLGVNNSLPGGTGLSDTLTKLPVTLAVNPMNGNVVGVIQTSPGVFVPVFAVSVDASGNVTLNQFRAVYHSDGTYVAGADSDAPETLLNNDSITLTATATDFDGDTASQTVGIGQMLSFGDDFPAVDITVVDDNANFLITQDADTIGTNTDVDASGEVFNGAFSVVSPDFGNDGPFNGDPDDADQADWSLSLKVAEGTVSGLTSGGAAIRMYIDVNGVVIGSTAANEGLISAANTIFTVAVDQDGVVTLSQMAQIDHTTVDPSATAAPFVDHVVSLPDGLVGLDVTYTITDGDLDTASDSASLDLGGNIRFADDGPSITVSATAEGGVELHTQDADTIGINSDMAQSTANFSSVFSAAPVSGADAPAGLPSWAYALSLTTGTSGLMSHGVAINLYDVGGTIVGSTALSAPLLLTDASIVFTVGVNNSGIVTLTQMQQVDHAVEGTTTAPFADQAAFILNDNAIQLTGTATVTDFDGDTATNSAVIGIANNLKFDDDGPDVSAALVSQMTIRIDETDNVVAAGGEMDSPGGNLGTVTVVRSAYVTVSDPHVSADAPTAYSYTLQLGAAGGNGLVASGLLLSTNNNPIYLYDVGGTIVGSTALTAPLLLTDPSIAFTVAINASGDVTLTQILAVEHGTPGASHDEDSSGLAAGALSVVVKATDYDGDTDTAPVDLGSIIRFEDDGPTINVIQTNEGGVLLTTQDGETIGVGVQDTDFSSAKFGDVFSFTSNGGSDGTANTPALSYALAVTAVGGVSGLSSHGVAINLYNVGGTIVGSTALASPGNLTDASIVFTVGVSSGGVVTLTQMQQVDHAVEASPVPGTGTPFDDQFAILAANKISLTATANIVDNDGDTHSDSEIVDLGGNIRFADHGPIATADADAIAAGFFGTATGNVMTGSEVAVAEDTNGSDGNLDTVGADAPGRISHVTFTNPNTLAVTTAIVPDAGSNTINGLYGVLTIFSNGDYSYDRNNDSAGGVNDVFTYTLRDFDGDTATATLTITIGINPPVAANATAKVDDDGIPGVGQLAPNPDGGNDLAANDVTETGAGIGNERIYTGSLADSVTGGDGDVDFRLVEPADGASIGQETVNYALTDNGAGVQTLTATIATSPLGRAGVLFTVVLDQDTGAYTVTLNDNVLHGDDANDDEDGIEVTAAIGFIAKDVNGTGSDSNAATLTIQFNDDVPTAVTDSVTQAPAAENASFTIDALANDRFGADGVNTADATKVVIVSQATQGTVSYSTGTGLFTYTPTNSDGGSTGTADSFTYKIIDADGDESTATVNITLRPDSTPQVVNVVAAVDDDGLVAPPDAVLTGEAGDINANTGEPGATASEAIYTGQITVNFGGDTGTVNFSNLNNTFGQVGTEWVKYTWSGTTLTATVHTTASNGVTLQPRAGEPLFQVTLSPAGAYTVTLLNNVLQASGGNNENSAPLVELNYTAVETGGFDPNTTGKLSITFNDDIPTLSFNAPSPVTTKTATGTMNLSLGADDYTPATLVDTFINVTANGGTVGATPVALTSFVVNPAPTANTNGLVTYSFSFSYDNDPVAAGVQSANGTGSITINEGTGQYSVTIDQAVGYSSTVQTSQALSITPYQAEDPADNAGAQAEFSVSQLAPEFFIQFSGDHNDLNYSGGSNGLFTGSNGYVSVSGDANGVNSDTIQQQDVLNLDFYKADPGGDSTPEQARAFADAVFFQIDLFGNGEDGFVVLKLVDPNNPATIVYRTFQANTDDFYTNDTGSPPGYNFTLDQNDAVLVIEANDYRLASDPVQYVIAGLQYVVSSEGTSGLAYDLNGATGAGGGLVDLSANTFGPGDVTDDNDVTKIVNIGFKLTTSAPQPITLNFNVELVDQDGDSTGNVPLSVTFPASVMPVVIDVDGDGAEFLGQAAGVGYDYDNDGVLESTAWAGADDGILVRDANGDGTVSDASEFVFGGDGVTDLEALAAEYGSTLDASDADFGQFAIWQDANSNGVADAGELQSLAAHGITSVSLQSDGVSYIAAGGDVAVAGTGTFTRADGSTGSLADAAFATSARAGASEELKLNTAANSNTTLIAAVAAAGLAATPVAASAPSDSDNSGDVASAAIEASNSAGSALVSDEADTQSVDAAPVYEAGQSEASAEASTGSARTMEFSRELVDSSDEQEAPSELSEGTDAPAPVVDAASLVADAIPSAEALIAAAEGIDAPAEAADATADSALDIGKIIADALAGGESPALSIDAVIDAIAGPAESAGSEDSGSTQALADVSMWHGAAVADYGAANAGLSMDMANHPDAVQVAA